MKRILILLVSLIGSLTLRAQDEVYELRTYALEFFKPAETLHNYFKQALIPALNRHGVDHVGAFEEVGEALPKKIYLLIAHKNIKSYLEVLDALEADMQYQQDAGPYFKSSALPFNDISVNLIRSTAGFPNLVSPAGDAAYFELRIYESPNEDALRRKVKMFNESEFTIFKEVGLPTVFFGYNIAGDHMPCLTYLLAFKDREAYNEAWSKFGPHPEWQRISKLEEYKDVMNDIIRVFLKPLPYSKL